MIVIVNNLLTEKQHVGKYKEKGQEYQVTDFESNSGSPSSFMKSKWPEDYYRYNKQDNISDEEEKLKNTMKKTTHGFLTFLVLQVINNLNMIFQLFLTKSFSV